ncbi:unnamed protein product [Closterium sp. NIES-65]|nr:unnamed protein product [Closterium sp. NIES-65]CAI5957530.1 unnamed protein product [Closterium sp. NIES-65]
MWLQRKEPFMSPSAIHQLHLFIFFLVAGHIVYTCVIIISARAKVSTWHRWENKCQEKMKQRKGAVSGMFQECGIRSPHPRPAGLELRSPTYRLPPPSLPLIALPSSSPVSLAGHLTRALQDRSFILRRTGSLASMRRCVEPVVEADVAPDVVDAGSSSAGGRYDVEQSPSGVAQEPELAKTFEENVKEEKEVQGQGSQGQQVREQARAEEAREPARRGSKLQVRLSTLPSFNCAIFLLPSPFHIRPSTFSSPPPPNAVSPLSSTHVPPQPTHGNAFPGNCSTPFTFEAPQKTFHPILPHLTPSPSPQQCFFQQLFNPITQSDYYTLGLAFIHVSDMRYDIYYY